MVRVYQLPWRELDVDVGMITQFLHGGPDTPFGLLAYPGVVMNNARDRRWRNIGFTADIFDRHFHEPRPSG